MYSVDVAIANKSVMHCSCENHHQSVTPYILTTERKNIVEEVLLFAFEDKL